MIFFLAVIRCAMLLSSGLILWVVSLKATVCRRPFVCGGNVFMGDFLRDPSRYTKKIRKLGTARSTYATVDWSWHLSSTRLEDRTSRPLVRWLLHWDNHPSLWLVLLVFIILVTHERLFGMHTKTVFICTACMQHCDI